MRYAHILKGFDESKHPRDAEGQFTDALSYPALQARGFKVSKIEAGIVMARTAAAEKVLSAINDAVREAASFGNDIKTVNETLGIFKRRVIPRAILHVQADEDDIIE